MAMNEQDGSLNKYLIITIFSIVILLLLSIGINYFVTKSLLTQEIGKIKIATEELSEDEAAEDELQKGIIVDLGDFILNLCDFID